LKNPLSEIKKYLLITKVYIGYRVYIVYILSLFSALTEGLGVLVFVPIIISTADKNNSISTNSIPLMDMLFDHDIFSEITFLEAITLFCFVYIIRGILVFSAQVVAAYYRGILLRVTRRTLLDSILKVDYQYLLKQDTGVLTNLVTEQSNRLLIAFNALIQLGISFFQALIYITMAYLVAWKIGLLVLLFALVIAFVFKYLNSYVRVISRKMANHSGVLATYFVELIHGFKYLTATNQTKIIEDKIDNSISKLASYEVKTVTRASFTQSLQEPIAVLLISFVLILHYFYFEEPLYTVLLSIIFFYRSYNSVFAIQGYLQYLMSSVGGMESVHAAITKMNYNSTSYSHIKNPEDIDTVDSIEFRNVDFSYKGTNTNIFSNLNFCLEKNKSYAVVGPSGCGKTTLLDLITLNLIPSSGNILFNDLDSTKLFPHQIRNSLGYVSQDSILFDNTIMFNITMGRINIDNNDSNYLRSVCINADIMELINNLPQRFETVIGERGLKLSGGQRQRLLLARELYRNTAILILDEATSALDTKTESKIHNTLKNLKTKKTLIYVTHRLNTLTSMDMIFVMANGKIQESGTYQQLVSNNNSYLNVIKHKQT
jgi:ABC-type multidrug transport system fused ATPase/permease subunit